MFGIVLISISSVMHIYVFWRAATVPFVHRHVPLPVLIGAGVVLWIIFYLGRVVGHHGTGVPAAALEFIGMNWTCRRRGAFGDCAFSRPAPAGSAKLRGAAQQPV